jgi:hypothetical protein
MARLRLKHVLLAVLVFGWALVPAQSAPFESEKFRAQIDEATSALATPRSSKNAEEHLSRLSTEDQNLQAEASRAPGRLQTMSGLVVGHRTLISN